MILVIGSLTLKLFQVHLKVFSPSVDGDWSVFIFVCFVKGQCHIWHQNEDVDKLYRRFWLYLRNSYLLIIYEFIGDSAH